MGRLIPVERGREVLAFAQNQVPIEGVYTAQPIDRFLGMPHPLVKAVAMLLLVMQAAVSMAPGQVICLPASGTSQMQTEKACTHCDAVPGRDGSGETPRTDEKGGLFHASHPRDDCGRHTHVPVPDEDQVPSSPRGDIVTLKAFIVPLVVVLVLSWDHSPPRLVGVESRPRDYFAFDQVLAIKTTRLLV